MAMQEAVTRRPAPWLDTDAVHPLPPASSRPNPASRYRRGTTFWSQWLAAMLLLGLLLWALAEAHAGAFAEEYRLLGALTLLGSPYSHALLQPYHKRHDLPHGLARLLAAWLLLAGTVLAVLALVGDLDAFSPAFLRDWLLLGLLVQALSQSVLYNLSRRFTRRLRRERRALIVGSGPTATALAGELRRSRVPLRGQITCEASDAPVADLRLLGSLEHLAEIIEREGIRRVYLALPWQDQTRVEALYQALLDLPVDVVWVPDLQHLPLLNPSCSTIGALPALYLNETLASSRPGAFLIKSLVERSLAATALLALTPLLLAIALAVKLSSPGPVLFRQQRHGWNGRVIEIWKFRTMYQHEDDQLRQATRHDPRVTPVGRFLRRSSLDELPQLFNVLRGDMALVGPRPHAVLHNLYYSELIHAYMARHRTRPGLTGLAQVNGFRGETETLEKMRMRVAADLAYINRWSFWLDLKILCKTPFTLLSRDIY
jgi:putative colanic acid biosynthesis UDP-glucose lipid carrier transferase